MKEFDTIMLFFLNMPKYSMLNSSSILPNCIPYSRKIALRYPSCYLGFDVILTVQRFLFVLLLVFCFLEITVSFPFLAVRRSSRFLHFSRSKQRSLISVPRILKIDYSFARPEKISRSILPLPPMSGLRYSTSIQLSLLHT